jgi:hypothetical protein
MGCCLAYIDLFREFIAPQEFLRRFASEVAIFEQWELRRIRTEDASDTCGNRQ